MSERDDERSREAREALQRVGRESETVGASSMRRIGDHFSGRDALGAGEGGATDPAELWGRRIGRALSVLAFAGLTFWLGRQLGWW